MQEIVKQDQWHPLSAKLMQCLLVGAIDANAKMDIAAITRQVMPNGIPDFRQVRASTPIAVMIESMGKDGYKNMMKAAYLMVQDFNNCINVVRPMNEDQMIEAAGMLVDECGDFRLEDYQIMFTLAKRGQLIKILDHIDIQVIGTMIDAYYNMRRIAGQIIQEKQFKQTDNRYNDRRIAPAETEEEKQKEQKFGELVGIMTAWKKEDDEKEEKEREERRKAQVEAYAKLHNVDINEVLKQFPPSPKKKPTNE